MEIVTKFDLGQHVYTIVAGSVEDAKECPLCEYKGLVHYSSPEFEGYIPCPKCDGTGIIKSIESVEWTVIQPFEIRGMHITTAGIKYFVGAAYYAESEMFATEDEAILECKKRNKHETAPTGDEGEE